MSSSETRPDQPVITGATRLYAIVGDPIAQAKSPAVYNALLAAAGRNAVLVPWLLSTADFDAGLRGLLRAGNVDGLVFTYPHKQAALPFADVVHSRARQVGATNALRRRLDGRWEADMFDGVGLVRALEDVGTSPGGRTIWLVGAGGAGGAIAFALAEAGASQIHLTDVEADKATGIAVSVAKAFPGVIVSLAPPSLETVSILINATPVGLSDADGLPVALDDALPASLTVVDIVPREATRLLDLARASGCRTVGGAAMVAGQAAAVLDYFGETAA
ncbi:shikimate dehydrogenase [Alsobacter metallidurans]|uniref:Shikimate dehydrogenase n=1 Tax=Alsobacter metallidurans TaxID=340221 RepID=A0A917MKI7_9HYPH|nr:hypothetical protein [Alsobacter metallidurans]GGH23995.1 shikimate dehydrogenase [Alsobacter metallidurans]